ncbi:MAG: glycerophosphodiester phosphodiesterase [Bacteroidetes bacterium]|nr:glycerophosphodiester phosphodiesterase [Bacteroidota bacterium]
MKKPLIIAHRGFSGIAPENTFAAFKLATELGVDLIELDIHQTKDGVLVCHHDEDISRTTGSKEKIKDILFEELQKKDAGSWFSEKFKGEPIPSLEQVLSLGVPLLIEVKKGNEYYPGIVQNLLQLLSKFNHSKQCIIQSFETPVLEAFSAFSNDYELHKLVTGNIPLLPLHIDTKLKTGSITKYREFDAINPNFRFVTAGLIKKIHREGKKIFTWTVNEKEQMEKLISYGVDGIITDYPDRLKKLLI